MKPVLVDSDVLIEIGRGRDSSLLSRWASIGQGGQPIHFTPISLAELWHGVRPHEHAALDSLFSAMNCVPLDKAIGRRAGDYLRHFAKSHTVELGDALIAATASIHDMQLWTRNRKHYPMRDIEFF